MPKFFTEADYFYFVFLELQEIYLKNQGNCSARPEAPKGCTNLHSADFQGSDGEVQKSSSGVPGVLNSGAADLAPFSAALKSRPPFA